MSSDQTRAAPSASGKKRSWKTELRDRMQDPFQLRLFLTCMVLLIGYAGIELPLGGEVNDAVRGLRAEQRRLELIHDVERLRADYKLLEKRLPPPAEKAANSREKAATKAGSSPDSNEWARFVLAGIRKLPVKLALMETEATRSLGPYKVAVLRIALEGEYADLDAFLRWLETNERLVRVDRVLLEPVRGGALSLQVTVLGVMG